MDWFSVTSSCYGWHKDDSNAYGASQADSGWLKTNVVLLPFVRGEFDYSKVMIQLSYWPNILQT